MNKEKIILNLIEEIRPDFVYDEDANLIDDGYLDSFDIVNLIMELGEEFEVEIGVEHIIPENFNKIENIAELIESLEN